mmetsp:Transcript_2709/g.8383  ORF Transcript_2709/g.8383 Transcript_2709/m.8383 type:complete len:415 (+) Transcript_2709:1267-2511(+)
MKYAMGVLVSERYGRYLVTILFDMFFTTILFKQLFSRALRLAMFTVRGREWLANAFVSAVISFVTFKVYANMTRFEWAYPSGQEGRGEWIQGQTMVLATVIMSMVYLTSETRARVGEPGINDPNIKLAVVLFTFFILWMLQAQKVIDPAYDIILVDERGASNTTAGVDVNLPLQNVCKMQHRAPLGFLAFTGITIFSLAFVIFLTSVQTLSGLRQSCRGCPKLPCRIGLRRSAEGAAATPASVSGSEGASPVTLSSAVSPQPTFDVGSDISSSSSPDVAQRLKAVQDRLSSIRSVQQRMERAKRWQSGTISAHSSGTRRPPPYTRPAVRNALPVVRLRGGLELSVPIPQQAGLSDRLKGKLAIFAIFLSLVFFFFGFFALVPFYSADGERDKGEWWEHCRTNYDPDALEALGLS